MKIANSRYNFTSDARKQLASLDGDLGTFKVEFDLLDEARESFSSGEVSVEGELSDLGALVEKALIGNISDSPSFRDDKLWITGVRLG